MHQGLTASLEEAATWLQAASQAVPVSQLSVVTWVVFLISGSFASKNAFNAPEQ